jgi:hypothetical protein
MIKHCIIAAAVCALPSVSEAQTSARDAVTFSKDVAPILQRSCQICHNPSGIGPMALMTYDQVRPWARAIKTKTTRREMPPWFIEKNIGIQHFKNDPSLNDEEIAKIAKWADSGAPRGNPADMPPPRQFDSMDKWTIGEPELVLRSVDVTVPAAGPDKWTSLGLVPTGLTEDRYVSAVEVKDAEDRAGTTSPQLLLVTTPRSPSPIRATRRRRGTWRRR